MSRRAKTYGRWLSRPSMPQYPGWPNQLNHDRWCRETDRIQREGIKLLLEHYSVGVSALDDRMRRLVLALARDHVPYFRTRATKSKKWDTYVMARLLRDVQVQIGKGLSLRAALSEVNKKLPKEFGHLSRQSLAKRYRTARAKFDGLVDARKNGALMPRGEAQGRIWNSFLKGATASDATVQFGPSSHDPAAVEVSGLNCDDPIADSAEE
jgi:hypothetical protein